VDDHLNSPLFEMALCGSPRYVALQLAHLALTQHPFLQEKPFTRLQELCPELCEEDCRLA